MRRPAVQGLKGLTLIHLADKGTYFFDNRMAALMPPNPELQVRIEVDRRGMAVSPEMGSASASGSARPTVGGRLPVSRLFRLSRASMIPAAPRK